MQRRVDRFALIEAATAQPGNLLPRREDLCRGIARIEGLEGAQSLVSRRDGLALAAEFLGDVAQLFKAFMVARS